MFFKSIVFVCILSWFVAQLLKVLICFWQEKKFDLKLFFSSGGMPSSHSAFVSSLGICVGLKSGFDSALFAICFVFGLIVMYDASGVRRAAGKQAKVINIIVENIEGLGIKIDEKLKELLGHSPIEVISGAVLGIAVALLFYKK